MTCIVSAILVISDQAYELKGQVLINDPGLFLKVCYYYLQETDLDHPIRTITSQEADDWNLLYYDSKIHTASFVLPRFAKIKLVSIVSHHCRWYNGGGQ